MNRSIVLVGFALLTLGVTSCVGMAGDSLGGDRPLVPPVPATGQNLPMAPPAETQVGDALPSPVIQEKHGVTTPDRCNKMAERFKREGRNVTLVRIRPNPSSGATLRFICIFEGPDAQEGYYHDNRYNSLQEYQ